jgi:(p)ppGpp synthase/HD superfamily hydrolase
LRAKQNQLTTADELLEQIKEESEPLQATARRLKKAVKDWEKNIEVGSKPSKPKKMERFESIGQEGDLPILHLGEIVFQISKKCQRSPNLPFIGMDCIKKHINLVLRIPLKSLKCG